MLQKNKTSILVNIAHHPVEKGNATIVEVPFRGQTLFDLKEQFAKGQNVIMGLDGVRCDDWGKLIPAASRVVILPAAADPIVSFVLFVAWNMAVAYGLSYLGGLLFGQDMKEVKDQPSGQSFAWNPHTTQSEGGAKPMCYGTNMHYGNVVARWTDVSGGDEVLYMILDYGGGPVQGRGSNEVYFNGQPSSNFAGVSIQERLGTFNQDCMTGFEKNKLEYRPGDDITNVGGSLTWTSPNKFFDDLEYTLEWPRGMSYMHKSGGRDATSTTVKVEVSEHDADSWTTLMNTAIGGNQLAPIYKIYKANTQVPGSVVRGKYYDLRFTKVSGDTVDRYISDLRLRSVREVVDVAFTRPGRALLGIRALATDQLSGHIDVKWVADDKLVRWYNGTDWGFKFTRNRAWIYLDTVTQPVVSGDGGVNPWTVERYDSLDPSKVDLAGIYEWAEFCDQQVDDGKKNEPATFEDRMPCDTIVDYTTDVWTLSYEIAQIGRFHPYWQGNILTGWVDNATTEPIDLITFDCVMSRSWKNAWAGYGEMAGSVETFYKDALRGYERTSRPVHNEDAGTYTRKVPIEGIGVTGQAFATRVGNHALQRNKLIKNVNSVRMFKDALRYRLGRVVRVQATVPDWGQTFRIVTSPTNNTVELDRIIVDISPGDLVFAKVYDTVNRIVSVKPYTVDSIADKVLTIAETWVAGCTPIKDCIIAIGVDGKIKTRRIIKMRHTVDNYFDVELETYNTDLFASDDLPPYIDDPNYVWPKPAAPLDKPPSWWDIMDTVERYMTRRPNIEAPVVANCEWNDDTPGGGSVSWTKRDSDEPIEFFFRGVSYLITSANTALEFIYWDPNFSDQFRSTNDSQIAMAAPNWIMCRNNGGTALPAIPMQLVHAGILQAGTITAALGQIANLTVTTAKIQDLAVETIKVANGAVNNIESAYTPTSKIESSGGEITIQSKQILVTGAKVLVRANAIAKMAGMAGNLYTMETYIYRGGTKIYEAPTMYNGGKYSTVTVMLTDAPAPGLYTYYFKINRHAYQMTHANRALSLQEVKK